MSGMGSQFVNRSEFQRQESQFDRPPVLAQNYMSAIFDPKQVGEEKNKLFESAIGKYMIDSKKLIPSNKKANEVVNSKASMK